MINKLHNQLQGAKFFTCLDMQGAYNLIQIKEGEEWKTAFQTCYGLYKYRVMPFGLTNALASCQRLVNNTLHKYLNIFVVAYLDNILIYSKTETKHIKHVKKVLKKLATVPLLLEPEKCEFHKEEVMFLGFIIGQKGIHMDPIKVNAVLTWPRPTTVKEVQSFLGFANFYQRFIQGYSAIAKPLSELTKKDIKFEWTKEATRAFKELKSRFTLAPILTTFDPEQQIILETDAFRLCYQEHA